MNRNLSLELKEVNDVNITIAPYWYCVEIAPV
jgi:hypothetical protein